MKKDWRSSLLKLLAKFVPLIALWFANLAGKRAEREKMEAEQNAINAEARLEYEKIEQRKRKTWLDG